MTVVSTISEQDSRCEEAVFSQVQVAVGSVQVLVIEDNDEHAEWIARLLSEESGERFEVERVASLEQAMMHLSQAKPDVILLDLGMPELEGFRSYAAIYAVVRSIPVVVLTGDESLLSEALVLASGVRDYLLKSRTSSQELRNALLRALRSGTAELD